MLCLLNSTGHTCMSGSKLWPMASWEIDLNYYFNEVITGNQCYNNVYAYFAYFAYSGTRVG